MKKIIQVLNGVRIDPPPIWLMRQAGRYLPEYRALRARSESFLELCYSAELACEATLQPVRRFGFDAAILFSDILVLPDALGQRVEFVVGEGPKLESLGRNFTGLNDKLNIDKLTPILRAIELVQMKLPIETALIGFCGAPWTLATYMIGEQSGCQDAALLLAYQDRKMFQYLIDLLTRSCIEWLSLQIAAGVDVVQIFDTWAGILPKAEFDAWCVNPMLEITSSLKRKFPRCKVIWFPRGATWNLGGVDILDNIDCIGIDTSSNLEKIGDVIGHDMAVQGNIDPVALMAGGSALRLAVAGTLANGGRRPHIINLGHGILPQTPIEHVDLLLDLVRNGGGA